MSLILDQILDEMNLADKLEDKQLDEIGQDVCRDYDTDLASRAEWDKQNEQWMKLAMQVTENKTFPWPNAANVKYPLLTTAALQFSARAYPSLVPSFDVVKARPIGKDENGQAMDIAEKISTHMSYQVFYDMDDWEESMDKLCLILPIVGCAFKKTYYSASKGYNCSDLIHPKDLIINYWAKSLESAARKTHQFWLFPNEIIERQREGTYYEWENIKFEGGSLLPHRNKETDKLSKVTPPTQDENTPRLILEQHCYIDIDDDGYKEPYTVIVDYETKKVFRIAPRFKSKDVIRNEKGKIVKIKAREYFTKFSFIPNPDGGFYDVGFGLLLGSINESANTLLNQLMDAGTLSNLQSGFLAKGLRIGKSGAVSFTPGEWKWVNNSYEDLRKGVFPMPTREPSNVLFQLLGMLVQSGKELASIAEIFTGKMPGQNTPASTTMATIEQGLKVFTSIYKRIYRSLGKEFEKLFELNQIYLDVNTQYSYEKEGVMIDETIGPELYAQAKVKIIPAADPNMVTETQKLMQITSMMELAQFGAINMQEVTRRSLEIHGVPGIPKLMEMPPPQPPLEITLLEMELKAKEADRQIDMMKAMSESQKRQSEIVLNLAKAKELGNGQEAVYLEMQLKREEAQMDIQQEMMKMMMEREKHGMKMQQEQEKHAIDTQVKQSEAAINLRVAEASGRQKLDHADQQHKQKMKQKETNGDSRQK